MSGGSPVDELTVSFSGLTIKVSKTVEPQGFAGSSDTSSLSSFSLVEDTPCPGALAGLRSQATEPAQEVGQASERSSSGGLSWKAAILAATDPAEFELLDLSSVRHLHSRIRAAGQWSPVARLGRALRLGVILQQSRLRGDPLPTSLDQTSPCQTRCT